MRKFAVLVDIDNVSLSAQDLERVFHQVEALGEIAYAKFYGFSDRKHKDLEDMIAAKAYDACNRMRLKTRNKSQQDVRIIIDAIKIACTNPEVDSFCIIAGEGDFVSTVAMLKSLGKYVAGGFVNGAENTAACHSAIDFPQPEFKLAGAAAMAAAGKPVARPAVTVKHEQAAEPVQPVARAAAPVQDDDMDLNSMFQELEKVVKDFGDISKE